MNFNRYDELCAEEAENRLAQIEKRKDDVLRYFTITFGPAQIEIDGVHTTEYTRSCLEEVIEDYTKAERKKLAAIIANYEKASKRSQERQESTHYSGGAYA